MSQSKTLKDVKQLEKRLVILEEGIEILKRASDHLTSQRIVRNVDYRLLTHF